MGADVNKISKALKRSYAPLVHSDETCEQIRSAILLADEVENVLTEVERVFPTSYRVADIDAEHAALAKVRALLEKLK